MSTIQATTVKNADTLRDAVRQENVNVFEFTYTSMVTSDLNINFNVDLFAVVEEWEFVEESVQHESTDLDQDSLSNQNFLSSKENMPMVMNKKLFGKREKI